MTAAQTTAAASDGGGVPVPGDQELTRTLGRECPACGDTYHDLTRHLTLNYKGCAAHTLTTWAVRHPPVPAPATPPLAPAAPAAAPGPPELPIPGAAAGASPGTTGTSGAAVTGEPA